MSLVGADRFFWASDFPHPDHTGDYMEALEEMVDEVPARCPRRPAGRQRAPCFRLLKRQKHRQHLDPQHAEAVRLGR